MNDYTLNLINFDDNSLREFRDYLEQSFNISFNYSRGDLSAYSFTVSYSPDGDNDTDVFDLIAYFIESVTETIYTKNGKIRDGEIFFENITRARTFAGTGENAEIYPEPKKRVPFKIHDQLNALESIIDIIETTDNDRNLLAESFEYLREYITDYFESD